MCNIHFFLTVDKTGGRTNTQAALSDAYGRMSGGRRGADDVIILVTDGQSNVNESKDQYDMDLFGSCC